MNLELRVIVYEDEPEPVDELRFEVGCTLGEFFEANEELTEEQREECECILVEGGTWAIGGGAAPTYRVELQR